MGELKPVGGLHYTVIAMKQLFSSLEDKDNFRNYIYHKRNTELEPTFQKDIEYMLQTERHEVDTFTGKEAGINQLVSENTDGMIQDLLAPGSFDGMTSLVLLNTVFFDKN